ncbi:MAG: flexitail domain-containing putative surface protein, partial [Dehalococcoidia bacterium]
PDDCDLIPGAYIHCISDVQQAGADLVAPILCYFDSTTVIVNPEHSSDTGDGLFGVPPPEPFADIEGSQTELTGTVGSNTISLEGCFEDEDGQSTALGHVYTDVSFNANTGLGTADIWLFETLGNCTGGTPDGAPDIDDASMRTVRQAVRADNRDTDTDGCPDASELSQIAELGGMRDPWNAWDYFNPTNDGHIRVDDILAVAELFGETPPGPPYDEKYDRSTLTGGNAWNIAGPDDAINADDVVRAAAQYRHDCGAGFVKSGTPTPAPPTAAPGLSFYLAVDADGNTTNDCNTNTGPTHCFVDPEDEFDLKVYLSSVPFSYTGLDFFVNHTGVTSNFSPDTVWPSCIAEVSFYFPIATSWGCVSGVAPPVPTSSFTGLVGTNSFTCDESGSVSLVHGVHDTTVLVNSNLKLVEGTGSSETLDITCGDPTATPTPVPTVPLLGNGPGDGPDGPLANLPKADSPRGMDAPQVGGGGGGEAAGSSDVLYFADTGNDRVRKIEPVDFTTGVLTTIAGGGDGTCGGAQTNSIGDGCPPTNAILNAPRDVFIAPSGDIYIADTGHCRVRKITAGIISTVAGTGTCDYNNEGTATSAQLDQPSGVAVDAAGNLYIADTENCRIRKVASGVISTVAGTGTCGYIGDSVLAIEAQLNRPRDVSVLLPDDDIVIADTNNHRIRRVNVPGGTITSIAGTGNTGYSGTATVASTAAVNAPEALDAANYRVVFADTGHDRIRRIDTLRNTINTMVGPDGLAIATLIQPGGVALLNVEADGTGGDTTAFTETEPDRVSAGAVGTDGETVDTLPPTTSCSILPGTSSIDWMLPAVLLGLVVFRKRITTLFIRLNSALRSLRGPAHRVPSG